MVSSSVEEDISIDSLWVFPIKSAKGIKVDSWEYTEEGLQYDRQWMIVEDQTHNFLTARTIPKMVLLVPSLDLSAQTLTLTIPSTSTTPSSSHTIPISPSAETSHETDFRVWGHRSDGYLVGTPELDEALSVFMGKQVRLVKKGSERREAGPDAGWVESMKWVKTELESGEPVGVGFADQYATLLTSLSSLRSLHSEVLSSRIQSHPRINKDRWNDSAPLLEIERFRGNIIIDGKGLKAWEEDSWGELSFEGEGGREEVMYAVQRCARCMLPNVDPTTGVRDAVVPDLVLRPFREGVDRLFSDKVCFGMNMVAKRSRGTIKVGDKVKVVSRYEKKEGGNWDRPEDKLEVTW